MTDISKFMQERGRDINSFGVALTNDPKADELVKQLFAYLNGLQRKYPGLRFFNGTAWEKTPSDEHYMLNGRGMRLQVFYADETETVGTFEVVIWGRYQGERRLTFAGRFVPNESKRASSSSAKTLFDTLDNADVFRRLTNREKYIRAANALSEAANRERTGIGEPFYKIKKALQEDWQNFALGRQPSNNTIRLMQQLSDMFAKLDANKTEVIEANEKIAAKFETEQIDITKWIKSFAEYDFLRNAKQWELDPADPEPSLGP